MRYFFIAVMLAVVLAFMFFLAGIDNILVKSLFLSGIFAVYFTNLFFTKQNLWVLYYNLCLPKSVLLGLCLFSYEVLSIIIVLVIL